MSDGHMSSNGGFHHEDRDMPSPPLPTTIDDVAAAVGALAAEVRDQHLVVGERLQALHDRGGEHEKASIRRHDSLLKAVQTQADATLAVAAELSALGRHVERLAAKSEVAALGAQVGRNAADSVTNEHRHEVEIAAVRRLALVRKGAFAAGVAIGTGLVLEWRWAFKTLVSLLGG